jgi:hypothetical protein
MYSIRDQGYPPTPTGWGQFAQRRADLPESLTLDAVGAEVLRARAKFPGNRNMLAALTEEVGELATALLQGKPRDEIEREAIQVAAMAVRIIEEGDASFSALTEDEKKA